jgi:hypothetical protein
MNGYELGCIISVGNLVVVDKEFANSTIDDN